MATVADSVLHQHEKGSEGTLTAIENFELL